MGVTEADIPAFIQRWGTSDVAERANYQLLLAKLCSLIEGDPPHPKKGQKADNAYVFEKAVPSLHSMTNFIDLYKLPFPVKVLLVLAAMLLCFWDL